MHCPNIKVNNGISCSEEFLVHFADDELRPPTDEGEETEVPGNGDDSSSNGDSSSGASRNYAQQQKG